MRPLSRATIQGRGGSRDVEDVNRSGWLRRNMKSIRYKHGRGLRPIQDKKLIYVNAASGRSLRMFTEKF
jgi:hypothetical protein